MKEYLDYLKVCKQAITNDRIFKNFRKVHAYHNVVEGVSAELGEEYLLWARQNFPDVFKFINQFLTNDDIGHPAKYQYDGMSRRISSSTCRYIKILAELIVTFGSLKDMDIVEIGGGYGGQCKIICDYEKPRSYTIIDLPGACALTDKYLRYFKITDVGIKSINSSFENEKYSLCISNYAFSEFDRKYQDFYVEHIINNSERGYMLCNFFGKYYNIKKDRLTEEEISKLKSNGKILPEEPLTTEGNFLYIWGNGLDTRRTV